MEEKQTRRGYSPEDERIFKGAQLSNLKKASKVLSMLLNEGYQLKQSTTFIGNRFMFSERQRLSLARTISSKDDIYLRAKKEIDCIADVDEVNIDGFNAIILLEVALSGSPIFECMDGSLRDLAGLRGTYKIIDKTEIAINLILEWLDLHNIEKANIFLDSPVSNSIRLKMLILEIAEHYRVNVNIDVIHDVDRTLYSRSNVISGDAIILNECHSWINMYQDIIKTKIPDAWNVKIFN